MHLHFNEASDSSGHSSVYLSSAIKEPQLSVTADITVGPKNDEIRVAEAVAQVIQYKY